MVSPDSTHFFGPVERLDREGPDAMQAFVSRHRAFFILLGVMTAQLLLLSVQITRNHNVRLIQWWAVRAFDPFERSFYWTLDTGMGAWQNLRGLRSAERQNQELNAELADARAEVLRLSQQADEAVRLRALLNFKNQLPFQTVAAEVIASSPGERSEAIFIDKGADSGFSPDMGVITPAGVVGKIIAVFPHSSQVLLLTDLSNGVGCFLEKSRIQGVLKGAEQGLAQLRYVMNEQEVQPGELVFTSGLDQIYPKGLPVGRVVRVGVGNIYKNIAVKPSAELDRLETVLVILKSNSPPAPVRAPHDQS